MTVSTGEASLIADLAPRTGLDLPPIPAAAREPRSSRRLPTMGYIGNPLDPWGAADPATAYGAAFEAMADSGAYDVLVARPRLPVPLAAVRGRDRQRRHRASCSTATARPAGDPAGLRLADLGRAAARDQGAARRARRRGAAPARRARGVHARSPSVARWEARRARRARRTGRGGRAGRRWPRTGRRTARDRCRPRRRGRGAAPRSRCPSARASSSCAAAGPRRHGGDRRAATPTRPSRPPGALGGPVALKLDAVGLAHKSDVGGVALGLRGDDARPRRRRRRCSSRGRARTASTVRGLLVEPMADRRASS